MSASSRFINRLTTSVLCIFALAMIADAFDINPKSLKETEAKVKKLSSEVLPAVVSLVPDGPVGRGGSGTGVIVNKDGLILTAAHVTVEMNDRVTVIFPNGDRARGVVLGMDFTRDSAMVQITDKGEYPFVELGESKPLKPNDWCIALGHAGGFQSDRSPPVRLGRILTNDDKKWITSDCTLIGGDSGGPLFNLEGKLIGIHSNIGQQLSENRHVPISTFVEHWDQLKNGSRYGGSHVGGFLANPDRAALGASLGNAKNDSGALIQAVMQRSPAAMAGLKKGDRVVKADDSEIKKAENLKEVLNEKAPGDRVILIVKNGETERGMSVKLVAAKNLRGFPRSSSKSKPQPKPKKEDAELGKMQPKFDKRMKQALKDGILKIEDKEVESYGGPKNYSKLMNKFMGGLSKEDRAKFQKMADAPPPVDIEKYDPDALIEFEEKFFRDVLNAFHPSVEASAEATHLVFRGRDLKSLCTIVHEDGYALTKASELDTKNNQKLTVMIAKGKMIPAKVVKQFPKNDLALIKLDMKEKMAVVAWYQPEDDLPIGTFIAAVGSSPDPVAIGVISVMTRTLAGQNRGYIGIIAEHHSKGVRVSRMPQNGPARRDGLEVNDVIQKIEGKICDTPEKLNKMVSSTKPGTAIKIDYLRDGQASSLEVTLGDRGKIDDGAKDRNGKMNKFGTRVSDKSTGFQNAIQTDLPISPQQCGGPVVDLDGNVIGLNISRAGRIKTYTLPSSEVVALLDKELEKAILNSTPEPKKKEAAKAE
ncbi:S1C family serine protease [Verrucomicrobiales bacterium]|nr:S1C family serine protease [Verrucomicrobiales bacterium]